MVNLFEHSGFGFAAAAYADVGIATIPLGGDDGKRPLVLRPKCFRTRASLKIASKFPSANVGIWCGPTNGLTVVDIDTQDYAEVEWALEKFGASPVIVRTGSGKYHIYYRHNVERRRIRPFPEHEIDLLGDGGYCVAPPSIRPGGGAYTFIKGSIADLAMLPTIRKGALDELVPCRRATSHPPQPTSAVDRPAPAGAIREGDRNNKMFLFARQQAAAAASLDDLVNVVRRFNDEGCVPSLPEVEVLRTAKSAWQYKTQGRLWLPGGTSNVVVSQETIAALQHDGGGDALLLLMVLNAAHQGRRATFSVSPEGMAKNRLIGSWDIKRYRRARDTLCRIGALQRLTAGGRTTGDPALYRFPST